MLPVQSLSTIPRAGNPNYPYVSSKPDNLKTWENLRMGDMIYERLVGRLEYAAEQLANKDHWDDGSDALPLSSLKYEAKSRGELKHFLRSLEVHFDMARITGDQNRVRYASNFLKGAVQRRWIYTLEATNRDSSMISWEAFEQWLEKTVPDEDTCSYLSESAINRIYQEEDEPFDDFLGRLEAAEADSPDPLPPRVMAMRLFTRMKSSLRNRMLYRGIPTTREEILKGVRSLELLDLMRQPTSPTPPPTTEPGLDDEGSARSRRAKRRRQRKQNRRRQQ
ncbi:hypothetical protein F4861DRAFT_523788 [Xylaria intraflava]|nr:hypothetical protein F4861DRAFT_523788 [Xylaria intraflava]